MIYKILITSIVSFLALKSFSQGLINNGARIVFVNSAQLYIDGVAGNYTNQSGGGLITPSANSTITLLGNWINNSAPPNVAFDLDGGAVVMAGAAQSIGGINPTAFNNLTLTGSGLKTLAVNSTTVGGQSSFAGVLALDRPLDLNSNRLDVTNNAVGAITRTSGYIISETTTGAGINNSIIRWYHGTVAGSKVYPFGVSAGFYIPFTFNITTALPLATSFVDVSTRTSPSNNTPWAGASNVAAVAHMYSPNLPYLDGTIPAVIDRWWDISPNAAVTANVTFSYLGSENTLDPLWSSGLIGAQYWDGSGWMPNNAVLGSAVVVSGVGVVGSVTASGLTSFCPWILSALLSPLPIELLNFDATCNNNKVNLKWCTATETNNKYFTVEYSSNGIDFTALANVAGSGTSFTKHCYDYEATSLSNEINYYRLKQTDNSGKVTSSKIISINDCQSAKDDIIITNNGTSEIGVLINSTINQKISLQVHNSLGQLMLEKELFVVEGFNNLRVDLFSVANGVYYLTVLKGLVQMTNKKIIVALK